MTKMIRKFRSGYQLSVEFRSGSWFVTAKSVNEKEFSTHCGPYSTMDQAIWWIKNIREK
jgi:hypothetical protein